MTIYTQKATLRAKQIGVLLKDARLKAGKSIKECAEVLGITPSGYRSFERGVKSPSLPELEMLAYTLNVLPAQFFGREMVTVSIEPKRSTPDTRYLTLRHRVIGALIRQARINAERSRASIAREVGISPRILKAYETGERPIPVPHLEALAEVLNLEMASFQDQEGPVGRWVAEQRLVGEFLKLPRELQEFVTKPINRPYLELANTLSELPAEKLRTVAEGLLDITL
jgi:transcriptional regulator with XRE-family HTH domain